MRRNCCFQLHFIYTADSVENATTLSRFISLERRTRCYSQHALCESFLALVFGGVGTHNMCYAQRALCVSFLALVFGGVGTHNMCYAQRALCVSFLAPVFGVVATHNMCYYSQHALCESCFLLLYLAVSVLTTCATHNLRFVNRFWLLPVFGVVATYSQHVLLTQRALCDRVCCSCIWRCRY